MTLQVELVRAATGEVWAGRGRDGHRQDARRRHRRADRARAGPRASWPRAAWSGSGPGGRPSEIIAAVAAASSRSPTTGSRSWPGRPSSAPTSTAAAARPHWTPAQEPAGPARSRPTSATTGRSCGLPAPDPDRARAERQGGEGAGARSGLDPAAGRWPSPPSRLSPWPPRRILLGRRAARWSAGCGPARPRLAAGHGRLRADQLHWFSAVRPAAAAARGVRPPLAERAGPPPGGPGRGAQHRRRHRGGRVPDQPRADPPRGAAPRRAAHRRAGHERRPPSPGFLAWLEALRRARESG